MDILEKNVDREIDLHPANHLPSSLSKKTYDIIIIGSGPVGGIAAARAVAAGASCLLVEQELVGGDCHYWACIPSKALLRPAEALEAAKSVGGAREKIDPDASVDSKAVFERRDAFADRWKDQPLVDVAEAAHVDIARGKAVITGIKEVTINPIGEEPLTVEAKMAVAIATGSSPLLPGIPGLADVEPWGPRQATSSKTVPDHLMIIGSGVVGCEMATAYTQFGAKVTIISPSKHILKRYPLEASKRVEESLTKKGVSIVVGHVEKANKDSEGKITLELQGGDKVTGSNVLVATGRRPRIVGMGLEKFGLSEDTPPKVDNTLCVQAVPGEWLYAIGDVSGRSNTTHMGVYQGKRAIDSILARSKAPLSEADIGPWSNYSASADTECPTQVVFTEPTIASAGLSLAAAKERGINTREVTSGFQFPGGLLYGDDFAASAWAQWIIDEDQNTIVGATFVGRDATDMLHASTVAIVGKVPLHRLQHAVASFPSRSEIYTSLLSAAGL